MGTIYSLADDLFSVTIHYKEKNNYHGDRTHVIKVPAN